MTAERAVTLAALLDLRGGFQLLEVVGGVLGQLVVVEVLVATVAGELLSRGLRLLDHLFHHLLGLRPSPFGARSRRRRITLRRDRTLALVATSDRPPREYRKRQNCGGEDQNGDTGHGLILPKDVERSSGDVLKSTGPSSSATAYSLDGGGGTSIQARFSTVTGFQTGAKPDIVMAHATDPRAESARCTRDFGRRHFGCSWS